HDCRWEISYKRQGKSTSQYFQAAYRATESFDAEYRPTAAAELNNGDMMISFAPFARFVTPLALRIGYITADKLREGIVSGRTLNPVIIADLPRNDGSVMQLSWRTRLYLCLHILRVLRDSLLLGEGSSLELFLLNILKAPKEMEVESSEDSLLAAEIVHVVEAAYKVYGPVLSQILHPTMRTELIRGTGFPQGLWVWQGDDEVDPEGYVVLYYLHGGGYCFFDGITSHLELATRMIAELQDELSSAGWADVKVVAFILDYSLAPQAILPTQLEEAVEGYKYILSQDRYPVEAGDIVISGDSAGGALVLSLLKCLHEGAFGCGPLAGPACAHTVSPMLSLSRSLARGSYNFNGDFLSNCLLWYSSSCALYGCPSRPGERHPSSRARVTEEAFSFEWRQIRGKAPEDKQDESAVPHSGEYLYWSKYCHGVIAREDSKEAKYVKFAPKVRMAMLKCIEVYSSTAVTWLYNKFFLKGCDGAASESADAINQRKRVKEAISNL
ncbi:hypothetical protein FOZ60_011364, partial [Perkinsus olseni]